MAYFEEGSKAMVDLEAMVDRVGVANVLYALAHIAREKAAHIEANWQDKVLATIWQCRADRFDKIAATGIMHEHGGTKLNRFEPAAFRD